MNELAITRNETSAEGTFGLLEGEALRIATGELPWHNNQTNISCIPVGWYLAKPHVSPKHGPCFWLQGVPGRSEILIHAANWMGEESLGYKNQLAGCIAVGMSLAKDVGESDQDMIKQSQMALKKLIEYTEFKAFGLTILNTTDTDMS